MNQKPPEAQAPRSCIPTDAVRLCDEILAKFKDQSKETHGENTLGFRV